MQIALPEINQDWVKLETSGANNGLAKIQNNSDAWYELGVAQEKT